ncbi:MAG: hypothetical protein ABSF62_16910 [Bryobacteraceae bacterium]
MAAALGDGQRLSEIFSGKYAAFAWRPNPHPDPRTADAHDQDLDLFADEKSLAFTA